MINLTTRVLCSAIADKISRNRWRITVTGEPPHAEQRVYDIGAKSDTLAAQRGIDMFVREMSKQD